MSNSSDKSFSFKNGVVKSCKDSLKSYFHTPDIAQSLKFNTIYKIFDLSDSKVAYGVGIDRSSMNRYRRGIWIPPTELKLKISQAISKLANYQIDSCILWGESLFFEKWRRDFKKEEKK